MDAEYVSMREMMEKILLREHSADGGKRGTETETRPAWRPGGGAGGGDVLRSLDQGQQACLSRQSLLRIQQSRAQYRHTNGLLSFLVVASNPKLVRLWKSRAVLRIVVALSITSQSQTGMSCFHSATSMVSHGEFLAY